MKENNGKAARLRLYKKLIVIWTVFFFACVLILCYSSQSVVQDDDEDLPQSPYEAELALQRHRMAMMQGGHRHTSNLPDSILYQDAAEMRNLTADIPLTDPDWQDILQGRSTLIDLQVIQSSEQIAAHQPPTFLAVFCRLDDNWHKYQQTPQETPMMNFLTHTSTTCQAKHVTVDLQTLAMPVIREYDKEHANADGTAVVKLLDFRGAIFHESRCGSTLIANMLASLPSVRVYSESHVPWLVLRSCGLHFETCLRGQVIKLVHDITYLMRRVSAAEFPHVQHVVWKMQSASTWYMHIFALVFGHAVPFAFVYREPTQVVMSHLNDVHDGHLPACAHALSAPNRIMSPVKDVLQQYLPGFHERMLVRPGRHHRSTHRNIRNAGGTDSSEHVTTVQFCAAHLASLTAAAVAVLRDHPQNGRAIPYESLPGALLLAADDDDAPNNNKNNILTQHFGLSLTEADLDRMRSVSGQYSKAVPFSQARTDKIGEFQPDSQAKTDMATPEVQAAVDLFMMDSYRALEELQQRTPSS